MRSDDIVPIVAANPPAAVTIAQGEVNSWNTTTGANSVSIHGSAYTNLKVVGPVTGYAIGNPVLVIKMNRTWYVLGKITVP